MAVLGEVIDIFPADAGMPARIEMADGRIAAIRCYDPVTQRSETDLDGLEVGRAAEPGSKTVSILDHLPPGRIALSAKADARRRRFVQLAEDVAKRSGGATDAVQDAAWATAMKPWRLLDLGDPPATVPRFAEARSPLAAMARFANPLLAEGRVFVLAGSKRDLRFLRAKVAKRLNRDLAELARWEALDALPADDAAVIEVPIDAGFVNDRFVFVAAADLLGSRALLGAVAGFGAAVDAFGSADIRIGDVVVHEDHGVACVVGLEPAPAAQGGASDMIALEYAAGARRLVPVDEADRLWRYGADAEAVTLDKLDGSSWARRRGDIDAAIAESARGLTELALVREKLSAPVLAPDPAAYERFVGGFAFNETADQARAIAAVRDDLASGKPMDRLIIGDVGYGKTEVALRAAALAALAGHQVIVAAPTNGAGAATSGKLPPSFRRDEHYRGGSVPPVHIGREESRQSGDSGRIGSHRRRHGRGDGQGRQLCQARAGRDRRGTALRRR